MVNNLKKIVFLDRDGVVNKKAPEHEYIKRLGEFVFNEGIFELLRDYQKQGFEFVVITNQRGVARGHMTNEDVLGIHEYMRSVMKFRGIKLLDIFVCPHEQDACDCRKPKPGMLEQAVKKYCIDKENSVLISDSKCDIEMGKIFGIGKNVLVSTDSLKVLDIAR